MWVVGEVFYTLQSKGRSGQRGQLDPAASGVGGGDTQPLTRVKVQAGGRRLPPDSLFGDLVAVVVGTLVVKK